MIKVHTNITETAINLQANEEQTLVFFFTEPPKIQKFDINLNGPQAKVTLIAIIIGKDSQDYPLEINLNHNAPHTHSQVIINSAMFDKSNITFHGNINIPETSPNVTTDLKHHSLILSPKAKTTTIPSLEIKNPDVKAGHSATVGNVDENLLFYLTSRGLSKAQATELLIKGFLEQGLSFIKDLGVKDQIQKEIESQL